MIIMRNHKIATKFLKVSALALFLSAFNNLEAKSATPNPVTQETKLIDSSNGQSIFLDSSLLSSLEAINTNEIKINELFYQKHPGTDYDPIKLEASLEEPLPIHLEDILARGVENNLNLNIARADSSIAKWQYWSRFSNMLPDVTMKASYRHLDGTFFLTSGLQSPIDQSISSAGIRGTYRAFNGGAKLFLTLAEKYYRQATNEREKSAYNKVLLDSISNYYNLLKTQVALAARLQSIKQTEANLDLAKTFFDVGTGTRYDVLQAEANVARSQQNLISEEATFRTSQILLAEHMNYPLLTPFVIDEKQIKDMKLIDESLTMKDFLTTAFKNNPDIRTTLKLKQAAFREALARTGDFLPYVDVYLDQTGTGPGFYEELFGLTTFGIEANYDIGKGLGATAATNALKARAQVKKAKLVYLKEVQQIEKNLRMSYIDFQKSKSLVEASLKELLAAEEALRLSKLRYENGLEIMINLLQRQTEFTNAQLNLINSTADYNIAQAKLAYNMGTISIDQLLNRY